jgi:hypothetical protein
MDRDRFDELARNVVSRSTRRTALGILSAIGLAGAAAVVEDGAARKKHKRKHKKRCKKPKSRCGRACCNAAQYCREGRCQPRPYAGGCLPEQNACLAEPNFCPDEPTRMCVPLENGLPLCGERFCSPCQTDAECVPQTGSARALCIPTCAICQDLGISQSACVIPAR